MHCIDMLVKFSDGAETMFVIHNGGDWSYHCGEASTPDRLMIRPYGRGVPRIEIPLFSIRYIQLFNREMVPDDASSIVSLDRDEE